MDKKKLMARTIQDLVEESTGLRPSYCAVLNVMEKARDAPRLEGETPEARLIRIADEIVARGLTKGKSHQRHKIGATS